MQKQAPFAGMAFCLLAGMMSLFLFCPQTQAWTLGDLNPWRHFREKKIFSLTRANPIGVRIMVVPVIDDPLNAPIYTRLSDEFANQLRAFADDVWLVTDLPNNACKAGMYSTLPRILAEYRLKNRLSMELITKSMPDLECDFIALFEVTAFDRYWIDDVLNHRVAVRAVLYDYQTGDPRLERFSSGARGTDFEHGAFNEAERIAIKSLVQELDEPLREAVRERAEDLERKYQEIGMLANNVGKRELAIHQYDLALMQGKVQEAENLARTAQREAQRAQSENEKCRQQTEFWKNQASSTRQVYPKRSSNSSSHIGSAPITYYNGAGKPFAKSTTSNAGIAKPPTLTAMASDPTGPIAPPVGALLPRSIPSDINFEALLNDPPRSDWEFVGDEAGK